MVIKRMYVRMYSYLRQSQFKNNFTVTQSILHTISLTQLFHEYFYKKKQLEISARKKQLAYTTQVRFPPVFKKVETRHRNADVNWNLICID
jgi:hypothetical protein